jgi:hypothetical protein
MEMAYITSGAISSPLSQMRMLWGPLEVIEQPRQLLVVHHRHLHRNRYLAKLQMGPLSLAVIGSWVCSQRDLATKVLDALLYPGKIQVHRQNISSRSTP